MGYQPYRMLIRMPVAINVNATGLGGTVTTNQFILDPGDFDSFEDKVVFEAHAVCSSSGATGTITLYSVTDSKALETLSFSGNTTTKQTGKFSMPNHAKTCNVQVACTSGALDSITLTVASVTLVQ